MISKTAIIAPGVVLGAPCEIQDFVVIGCSPTVAPETLAATTIGDHAVIRSHVVIYAGNSIGSGFHAGHKANIREANEIGDDVSIGTLSVIEHHVVIGHRVRIHTQAFIPEFTVLEDDCWIGPNVVLTNAKYPRGINVKESLAGPRVSKHAIVGANSTLLPGVTIGEYALIGAGSVVTKDVPAGAVVAGNPARVIKGVDELPYERT